MDEGIVRVIFGMSGMGKTVKLRRLLMNERRSLTVNTLKRKGFTNGVVFHDFGKLRLFWTKVYCRDFRLIYTPVHGDIERVRYEVGVLCKLALVCKDMTLAIEEMNVLFEGNQKPSEFEKVVLSGREVGVSLIGVAQMPVGFGAAMRAMTREAFIFRTQEKSHLDVFRNFVGKEGAEAINNLEPYQYLHWDLHSGQGYSIEKDEPPVSLEWV